MDIFVFQAIANPGNDFVTGTTGFNGKSCKVFEIVVINVKHCHPSIWWWPGMLWLTYQTRCNWIGIVQLMTFLFHVVKKVGQCKCSVMIVCVNKKGNRGENLRGAPDMFLRRGVLQFGGWVIFANGNTFLEVRDEDFISGGRVVQEGKPEDRIVDPDAVLQQEVTNVSHLVDHFVGFTITEQVAIQMILRIPKRLNTSKQLSTAWMLQDGQQRQKMKLERTVSKDGQSWVRSSDQNQRKTQRDKSISWESNTSSGETIV